MRRDMSKLIYDSGRVGPYDSSSTRIKYKDEEYLDNLPRRASMKGVHKGSWDSRKETTNYTTPLRRYLLSQVGRKWDDVFSEICRMSSNKGKGRYDIIDLVDWFVYREVKMIDGVPHTCKYGCRMRMGWTPLGPSKGHTLFVNPETGILEEVTGKSRIQRYRERVEQEKLATWPDGSKNVLEDGIWINIKTEKVPLTKRRLKTVYAHKEHKYIYVLDNEEKLIWEEYTIYKEITTRTPLTGKYLKNFLKWKETGVWPEVKGRKNRKKYFRKQVC